MDECPLDGRGHDSGLGPLRSARREEQPLEYTALSPLAEACVPRLPPLGGACSCVDRTLLFLGREPPSKASSRADGNLHFVEANTPLGSSAFIPGVGLPRTCLFHGRCSVPAHCLAHCLPGPECRIGPREPTHLCVGPRRGACEHLDGDSGRGAGCCLRGSLPRHPHSTALSTVLRFRDRGKQSFP